MKTMVAAVGKLRPAFREACDEYLARLRRYGEVVERELKEAPASQSAVEQLRDEGRRLLDAMPERAIVVALDRLGEAWTSEELATRLERWRVAARPVVLAVGGSRGLDQPVLERAGHRWSLGPLTLPHELARVVVVEQWYRAWTIIRGEQYHK
ncbi:MAG: 23S rRNA (pseudouridine(1915)-N(3))-methyltransferase RlmH [Gemmatimonadota bacterium]